MHPEALLLAYRLKSGHRFTVVVLPHTGPPGRVPERPTPYSLSLERHRCPDLWRGAPIHRRQFASERIADQDSETTMSKRRICTGLATITLVLGLAPALAVADHHRGREGKEAAEGVDKAKKGKKGLDADHGDLKDKGKQAGKGAAKNEAGDAARDAADVDKGKKRR
jgi:hypothetical protein